MTDLAKAGGGGLAVAALVTGCLTWLQWARAEPGIDVRTRTRLR